MTNPYAPPISDVGPVQPPALPLAAQWKRLVAALIDSVCVGLLVLGLQVMTGAVLVSTGSLSLMLTSRKSEVWEDVMWGAVGLLVWFGLNYAFLSQGQTLGKRLLRIQVRRKDGSPVGRNHYAFVRYLPVHLGVLTPWAWLPYLIFLIDGILIARESQKALHDDIAGTQVVQLPK